MDYLKKLKKLYGEKFIHLCRDVCPIGYQQADKLYNVLTTTFASTHSLYEDIMNDKENIIKFQNFLNGYFVKPKRNKTLGNATPEQLFDEAGYILFPECKTEKDVRAFKKFYEYGEELCTFDDKNRVDNYHIWFAVKKNVKDIKRENFKNPKRQDKYGTSVLCIQFRRKSPNLLSIKNRYNHTVENCDSTFDNNLDNIIPGLTNAFKKKYNFKFATRGRQPFTLSPYTLASDGKLYRYNLERNNIYYCENNVIIKNGDAVQLNKSDYLLVENFLFNLNKNSGNFGIIDDFYCQRRCLSYDEDSFIKTVRNNTDNKIDNIEILNKENNEKVIKVTTEGFEQPVEITINSHNELIGYKNPNVKMILSNFLSFNKKLKEIYLPAVTEIHNFCMYNNTDLEIFYAPNVEIIQSELLTNNQAMTIFEAQKLKKLGVWCFRENKKIETLIIPSIKKISIGSFYQNRSLESLVLNKDVDIGSGFLSWNPHRNELIENALNANETVCENIEHADENTDENQGMSI